MSVIIIARYTLESHVNITRFYYHQEQINSHDVKIKTLHPGVIVRYEKRPVLGFVIAGYSSDSDLPEEYQLIYPHASAPTAIRPPEEVGLTWNGEIEPLTRLILGHGSNFQGIVEQTLNLFKGKNEAMQFMQLLKMNSQVSVISPGMPLQDVIYLAEYLVDTAIKFAKYRPGAQTVGGPIEIAVISKHEGFKWIKRKHYFSTELNNLSATETVKLKKHEE